MTTKSKSPHDWRVRAAELLGLAKRLRRERGEPGDLYTEVIDRVREIKTAWPQVIDDRTPQLLAFMSGLGLLYDPDDDSELTPRLAAELELIAARVAACSKSVSAEEDKPGAVARAGLQPVTLSDAAILVRKTKAALESYKARKYRGPGKPLPPADYKGQSGQPDRWNWETLRPWLVQTFNVPLPTDLRLFDPAAEKR